MTNVQAGDLARVVAPYAMPGRGAIVKVLRRLWEPSVLSGVVYDIWPNQVGWVVEGLVRNSEGIVRGPELAIDDECLHKIPPLDETDEDIRKLYQPTPLLAAPKKPEPVVPGWEF